MADPALITHQIGDRLRIRLPARKGDTSYFTQVEQVLGRFEGVASCETNPLTGSILLWFDGDLDALIAYTARESLFLLEPPVEKKSSLIDGVSEGLYDLDDAIKRRSDGSLDLFELLFIGAIGAGVIQLVRGHWLGPAISGFVDAAAILAYSRSRQRQKAPPPG